MLAGSVGQSQRCPGSVPGPGHFHACFEQFHAGKYWVWVKHGIHIHITITPLPNTGSGLPLIDEFSLQWILLILVFAPISPTPPPRSPQRGNPFSKSNFRFLRDLGFWEFSEILYIWEIQVNIWGVYKLGVASRLPCRGNLFQDPDFGVGGILGPGGRGNLVYL